MLTLIVGVDRLESSTCIRVVEEALGEAVECRVGDKKLRRVESGERLVV